MMLKMTKVSAAKIHTQIDQIFASEMCKSIQTTKKLLMNFSSDNRIPSLSQ